MRKQNNQILETCLWEIRKGIQVERDSSVFIELGMLLGKKFKGWTSIQNKYDPSKKPSMDKLNPKQVGKKGSRQYVEVEALRKKASKSSKSNESIVHIPKFFDSLQVGIKEIYQDSIMSHKFSGEIIMRNVGDVAIQQVHTDYDPFQDENGNKERGKRRSILSL